MFFEIGVFKNLTNFTRKQLHWSLFLIHLQAWRPTSLLKKRLQHRIFPVTSARFLKTAFSIEYLSGGCFCFLFNKSRFFKSSVHVTDVVLFILLIAIIFVKQTGQRIVPMIVPLTEWEQHVFRTTELTFHQLFFLKKTSTWKLYIDVLVFYSRPILSIPLNLSSN